MKINALCWTTIDNNIYLIAAGKTPYLATWKFDKKLKL